MGEKFFLKELNPTEKGGKNDHRVTTPGSVPIQLHVSAQRDYPNQSVYVNL